MTVFVTATKVYTVTRQRRGNNLDIPRVSLKNRVMDEVEKFFKCPYCLEKISMLLDLSIEEHQTYIEDCEVCCQPIQIQYESKNGKIKGFQANKI